MYIVKCYDHEENVFKNPEDAIKYMYETNFEYSMMLYDIDSKDAYKKTKKIYEAIKEYNKGKPLKSQILPSNPYGCRGIIGCLGVHVYEILLGTYARNHESIVLFSGWNDSVLDTSVEQPCIRPGMKALTSLAMMGSMVGK